MAVNQTDGITAMERDLFPEGYFKAFSMGAGSHEPGKNRPRSEEKMAWRRSRRDVVLLFMRLIIIS